MSIKPQIVVVGSLNTDFIITGIKNFPQSGQQVYGDELRIGPGGKSCNIAQMIATIVGKGIVAMVGKSVKDPYQFWKHPIDALKKAGVVVDYINISAFSKVKKLPGIAIIPVDANGNNTIYVLPGVNDDFSNKDIDKARRVFKNAQYVVVTFERPIQTALYALKRANSSGAKVLLDPGGISEAERPKEVLKYPLFLLKPNEHETRLLTGVVVKDFETAQRAARILLRKSIENVFITHGEKGAYFFNKQTSEHIRPPFINQSEVCDETGCGDQTMAAICAFLYEGRSVREAVQLGVAAGTLQFHRLGISPVTKKEILNALSTRR